MQLTRIFIAALVVVSSLDLARADAPSPDYRLVWADEFNGTTLDRKKWDYRQLGKRRDAINVKETVRLDGKGHLVLEVGK